MSELKQANGTNKRRLRKQPKMRRVQSAHIVQGPKLNLSRSVKKRKRRNDQRISVPLNLIRQIALSSRWLSAGILALAVYALVLTGMEEDFYLTAIPVSGATSIPAQEIVEASQLAGAHIFAADPGAAAQSIMEVPGVISATVTLQWPNMVEITVGENKPVASWNEGDNQFWITGDGDLIPARGRSRDLVTIQSEIPLKETAVTADMAAGETEEGEGETGEETDLLPTPQTQISFIPEDVLAGALMLQTLRPDINQLYYRPATGLSYEDSRGWRVFVGTGTDMHQKLVVYEAIVAELEREGLVPEYISVANQEKPYYRAAP